MWLYKSVTDEKGSLFNENDSASWCWAARARVYYSNNIQKITHKT